MYAPVTGTPRRVPPTRVGGDAAGAPIVILFFLTQRTFIQGIALTGTKG
jgi:hypothetical protein